MCSVDTGTGDLFAKAKRVTGTAVHCNVLGSARFTLYKPMPSYASTARAMVSPLWSSKQVTRASCSRPSLANNAPLSMPLVGEGGKGFIARHEAPLIR